MGEPNCIFCKILAGEIPANFIYRDDGVVAITDVNPQAPEHVLVMPVEHTPNIVEYSASATPASLQKLMQTAARIGSRWNGGFRLVMNTGPDGGQTVDHLHIHLLAGRRMAWPPG